MYTSLIRSKIDYGSFLYATAKYTHLNKLNRVQYEAIRVIAGLLRATKVVQLEAEANLIPLEFRREQLLLNYFTNVLRIRNNPVSIAYFNFHDHILYTFRPYSRPVIGRARMLMERAELPIDKLERVSIPDLYLIGKPVVRYNLLQQKNNIHEVQIQNFLQLRNDKYADFVDCYTDGSKMDNNTGYAFVINDITVSHRLPSTCSVFTAELYAIYKAVEYIESTHWEKIVIFSDSLSALQAIDNSRLKCHYMFKLQKLLALTNKEIVLEYVPAHVGIPGNSKADEAAKLSTTNIALDNIILHSYDYKPLIKKFVFQRWQHKWSRTPCFLQGIKPILGDWKSAYREVRREEIVLARLRMNTPLFMVKHHIGNPPPPRLYCILCNRRQTVFHLTILCPHLTRHRSNIISHFNSTNMSINACNLLNDNFPFHLLFKFLHDVGYFNKV